MISKSTWELLKYVVWCEGGLGLGLGLNPAVTVNHFQGAILVMDLMGNSVGIAFHRQGVPLVELAWNCQRFNMEESADCLQPPNSPYARPDGGRKH